MHNISKTHGLLRGQGGKTDLRARQEAPRPLIDSITNKKSNAFGLLTPLQIQYASALRNAKSIDHGVRTPRSLVEPALLNANRV